jgi:hypothetical protein
VCSTAAVCAWQWWRRRCGHSSGGGARAAVAVVLGWCGQRSWGGEGGGAGVAAATDRWGWRCWPVGPRDCWDFFYLEKLLLPRAMWPHDTRVPRASEVALGKEPFAGPAVPSGLCREFPLGTGCAESIQACAERSLLSAQPQIPVVL